MSPETSEWWGEGPNEVRRLVAWYWQMTRLLGPHFAKEA